MEVVVSINYNKLLRGDTLSSCLLLLVHQKCLQICTLSLNNSVTCNVELQKLQLLNLKM